MSTGRICRTLPAVVLAGVLAGAASRSRAQEGLPTKEDVEKQFKPAYSPYVGREYPTRVLWGDTHLHTAISVDGGAFGCKLGPEDAYRFARGER